MFRNLRYYQFDSGSQSRVLPPAAVDEELEVRIEDFTRRTGAERFLRRLNAAVNLSNVRPLQFDKPMGDLLSKIFLGSAPANFSLGRECRMQDAADSGSIVRWSNFDLSDSTIRNHVADGMRLTHLAIEYANIMGCVIDHNGVISKVRFIGMDDDKTDELEPLARMDAEFVLITGTLKLLLADLRKLLQ